MPYTKDNPPDWIKGLPKHAQEIWISAYNNAIKQYDGDEEKANATAWAAVKKGGYKKNEDGKWVKMSEGDEPNFKEVEIFKTGDYPQGKFTPKDLDEIVQNYNPKKHEAPITIDHAFDGPAYGWVEKIWRKGSKLYAKIKDVSVWLQDQIKSGAYKKRSIEVWEDYENTGKKMLKAVSFLGAMIPQVKGLKNIYAEYDGAHGTIGFFSDSFEFKATEEDREAQKARSAKHGIPIIEGGHVTKPSDWSSVPDDQWADPVNFAYPCLNADQCWAALRYWEMPRNKERYSSKDQGKIIERLRTFAKKFEIKSEILKHSEVDMTSEEVKKMVDDALKEQSEKLTTKFSEELKVVKEENKELKEKHEKKFSEEALRKKEQRIQGEVDRLLKDGRITPAYVDAGFKKFLMAQPEDAKIEFGEGDKKKEIPVIDFAIDLFSNKIKGAPVHFGEIVKPEDGKNMQAASFRVVGDTERDFVDKDSFDLNDKALKYAKENKVDFKEALVAVSTE